MLFSFVFIQTCYEIIDRATATIQIWGDAGHCETFVDDTYGVEVIVKVNSNQVHSKIK